ncbi:Uncharacterized protein Fot_32518 [Forsythia ovata]|uniref:Uncharacterized protein n=1 Tax=Forsythia ovata TaxID=205694 RepID=A0ABD1T896_9LAMI
MRMYSSFFKKYNYPYPPLMVFQHKLRLLVPKCSRSWKLPKGPDSARPSLPGSTLLQLVGKTSAAHRNIWTPAATRSNYLSKYLWFKNRKSLSRSINLSPLVTRTQGFDDDEAVTTVTERTERNDNAEVSSSMAIQDVDESLVVGALSEIDGDVMD